MGGLDWLGGPVYTFYSLLERTIAWFMSIVIDGSFRVDLNVVKSRREMCKYMN